MKYLNKITDSLLEITRERILKEEKLILFCGTTTNSYAHIGNWRDLAIVFCMARYIKKKLGLQYNPKVVMIYDDMDMLTSLPPISNTKLPETLVGMCIAKITDEIDGMSFNSYFSQKNTDTINNTLHQYKDVDIEYKSNEAMYNEGFYDKLKIYIANNYNTIKEDLLQNLNIRAKSTNSFDLFKPIYNGRFINVNYQVSDEFLLFNHDGKDIKLSLYGSDIKLPFFIEFGYRSIRNGAIFENYGKDIAEIRPWVNYFIENYYHKIHPLEEGIALEDVKCHNIQYEMILDGTGKKISKRKGADGIGLLFESFHIDFILYLLSITPTKVVNLSYNGIINVLQSYINQIAAKNEDLEIYLPNGYTQYHKTEPLNLRKLEKQFLHILMIDTLSWNTAKDSLVSLLKGQKYSNYNIHLSIKYFKWWLYNREVKLEQLTTKPLNQIRNMLDLLSSNLSSFSIMRDISLHNNIELFYLVLYGITSGPKVEEVLENTSRAKILESFYVVVDSKGLIRKLVNIG